MGRDDDERPGGLSSCGSSQQAVSPVPASIPDAWTEEADGSAIGYMCLTDWEYEIGNASGGSAVYPSEMDLRRRRPCVSGCGIVKVRVSAIEVIQEATDEWDAQGMETGTAKTEGLGPKDDSPVGTMRPKPQGIQP